MMIAQLKLKINKKSRKILKITKETSHKKHINLLKKNKNLMTIKMNLKTNKKMKNNNNKIIFI